MAESNPNPIAANHEEEEAERSNPNPTVRNHEEEDEHRSNPNPTARNHEEEEGERKSVVFFNATRHGHELLLSKVLPAYKCSGCKEYGAKIGYKCSSSSCHDFILHEACATLPDVYQHPFRGVFEFRPNINRRLHCSACRDVVRGYVFETVKDESRLHDALWREPLRLHPLCMVLPQKLKFSGHAHRELKLKGDLNGKVGSCSVCNTNINSGCWRYRCLEVTCKVYLDISCAKIDIFGLSDYGIARVAPISHSRKFIAAVSSSAKCVLNNYIKVMKKLKEACCCCSLL